MNRSVLFSIPVLHERNSPSVFKATMRNLIDVCIFEIQVVARKLVSIDGCRVAALRMDDATASPPYPIFNQRY